MKTFNSHISQTSLRNSLNALTFLNVCTFNMFLSSPFSTIFAYLQTQNRKEKASHAFQAKFEMITK